jgi:SRSO17 transposase
LHAGSQYCEELGKQDNCQVAVTLSLACDKASLHIAFQLYFPESWAIAIGSAAKRLTFPMRKASDERRQVARIAKLERC